MMSANENEDQPPGDDEEKKEMLKRAMAMSMVENEKENELKLVIEEGMIRGAFIQTEIYQKNVKFSPKKKEEIIRDTSSPDPIGQPMSNLRCCVCVALVAVVVAVCVDV